MISSVKDIKKFLIENTYDFIIKIIHSCKLLQIKNHLYYKTLINLFAIN